MSVFVDTGAWHASVVPDDPHHAAVMAWHRQNHEQLITTDFVVDETLTLLRSRGEYARAIVLGRHFFDLNTFSVRFLTEEQINRAWALFRDNPNRDWSFTDCTSKVIIESLHLKQVLALDHHFDELGILKRFP